MDLAATLIGLAAALFTTGAYIPQVKKTWETQETGDLALPMLVTLSIGLILWCAYGIFRRDPVIILANTASLAMVLALLYWKLRNG